MSRATQGASGEIVLYRSPDGQIRLDVRLERDSAWLTQAQMAKLFKRDQSVISRHVRNVFSEGELPAGANMQKVHIASSDKPIALYGLDVIISVGYRVKSQCGARAPRRRERCRTEGPHDPSHPQPV